MASVLTIRQSRHGGGLYQVIPVGVFQPASPGPTGQTDDLDLWRFITREYNEELLGAPETTGDNGPVDYDAWPFHQALQKARQGGELRVFWLGVGVDPLSLVTDFLIRCRPPAPPSSSSPGITEIP